MRSLSVKVERKQTKAPLKKTLFHRIVHAVLRSCFMSETCASTHRGIHRSVVYKERQVLVLESKRLSRSDYRHSIFTEM